MLPPIKIGLPVTRQNRPIHVSELSVQPDQVLLIY